MSSTVDSRVVEMRFDNNQFERNVSTTMSTLDKLKQKLNLSGASKGLEDVDAAAKHVDMSSLGGAVDTVKAKFSALDVVAVTALTNITNSAVNAGKKLVSSLTIDQVSAGWQKFSDKTTSVATLVAQGNAIEDVNSQLNRLNWFTDETSYNFTDMVSNIAKFTATGKGLEESVTAMEGIANWAALSGQNAGTASRAMYQLSQAMGAGVLRLEDYKSIQNASMDTEEFRQKCIDAAIALKTLKKTGNDTYSSLVATGKKGAESFNISQFTTHLTDGAWLTSDVMMKVFSDYSSAVNSIYEVIEEKGGLASDVIDEIHQTAEQNSISIDEAIKKLGYNFDSFALKAFESAQKARTFGDAIESVKDAVSTGWMNTFELIFGDAEGATELWTDIANQLYDVFAAGGERRNEILEGTMISKWDVLIERINDAGIETDTFENKIIECAKAGGVNVDDLIKKYGSLSDVFKNGELSTSFLKEAVDQLTGANGEAANSAETVKETIKGLSVDFANIFPGKYGETTVAWGSDAVESVKKVQTALSELGYSVSTTGIFERETWDAVAAFQKDAGLAITGIVDQKTIDAMVKAGESLERVGEAADGVSGKAKGTKVEIDDLVDGISQLSGRELVFNIIHNTLEGILGILNAFRGAWEEVFPTDKVASGLHKFLEMIHSVTKAFILSDDNAKKLQSTFKGIISVFDILANIVGGALKIAFNAVSAIFDTFGFSILDITSNIGNVISAFRDWLLENELISKGFTALVEIIKSGIGIVKGWVNAFANIPIVSQVLSNIQNAFTKFSLSADDMDTAMKNVVEWFKSLKDLPIVQMIFEKLQSAYTSFVNNLSAGIAKIEEWFNAFKQTDGVQHLISAVEALADAFKKLFSGKIDPLKFATMFGDSLGRVFKSFSEIIDQSTSKITNWFNAFKQTDGVQHLISAVEGLIEAFKKLLSGKIDFSEFGAMLTKGLGNALASLPEIASQLASDFIAGFQNGLSGSVSDAIGQIVEFCKNFISAFKAALGIHSPSVMAFEAAVNFIKGFINGLKSIAGAVVNFFKEFGGKIIDFFKGIWDKVKAVNAKIDWDKIFGFALLTGAAIFLKKVADVFGSVSKLLGSAAGVLDSVKGVISNFGGVLKSFSKVLDGIAFDYKAKAMIKMAVAIAILVAAVLAIVYVAGDDYGKLWNAVGVILALSVIIGLLALAMSKLSASSMSIGKDGINIDGLKTTILQIGIAIALIAFAVKMLGDLNDDTAKDGFIRLGAIVVGMLVFAGALSLIAKHGGDISGIGSTMMKMTIAIALMAIVCKLVAGLRIGEMIKGAAFVAGFTLFVKYLVQFTKIGKKESIAKLGGLLLSISLALILMVGVCKLAAGLRIGEMIKGAAFVAAFTIFVKYLMQSIKLTEGESVAKIGGLLLSISFALILMVGACKLAAGLRIGEMIKGAAFVAAFAIFVKYLVNSIKLTSGESLANVSATILSIAVAIGILALAVGLIGLLPMGVLIKGVAVVGVLGLLMNAMIKSLKGAQNAKGAIIAMAATIGLMVAAVAILSLIPTKDLIVSVVSLVALMLAVSVLLKVLGSIDIDIGKAFKSVLALTSITIPLLAFVFVLKQMDGVENISEKIIALVVAMSAMALLLKALTLIGSSDPKAIGNAFMSVLALTAMAIPLFAFILVLKQMDGIENASEKIKALVVAMTAMTLLLGALTLIGHFGPAAIVGIISLVALFAAIGALAVGVGALMQNSQSLQSFLDTGLPVLEKLAGSIGNMIGNFVTSLGVSITDGFAKTAENLSTCMDKLQQACDSAKKIDKSAFDGVDYLLGVIVKIGKTSAKTSISDLFSNLFSGKDSMTKFGDDGVAFFNAMKRIGEAASEVKINSETFSAIMTTAVQLADFQKNLEPIGGVMDWFAGRDDLATFGDNAASFISSISEAYNALGDTTFNTSAMGSIISAATQLATLQGSLEPMGGMISWFKGRSDIGTFGEKVSSFITQVSAVYSTLGDTTFNTSAMSSIISAATQLATLQGSLEPMDGIIDWFKGKSDIGTFGEKIASFVTQVSAAYSSLSGATFNTSAMSSIISAATQLAALQGSLEPMGGIITWFNGRSDIGTFGEKVNSFITQVSDAYKGLDGATLNTSAMGSIISAATQLTTLQGSLEPIGGMIDWFKGKSDIGTFGSKVNSFVTQVGTAYKDLGNTTLNTSAMGSIISAATQLATLQGSLEPMNGVIDWFKGKTDIGTFGSNVNSFVTQVSAAYKGLGDTTLNTSAMSSIISAATQLATLEGSLKNMGGVIDWFKGRTDLKTFGDRISEFATAMGTLKEKIGENGISDTAIASIISTGTALTELQKALPTEGWFDGKLNLSEFSGYITQFGIAMGTFSTKAKAIDQTSVSLAMNTAYRIKNLMELLKELDTSGVDKFVGGGLFSSSPVAKIASAISDFSNEITDVDAQSITVATTTATRLKGLINSLADLNTSGVENFKPESIGKAIKAYSDSIAGIDFAAITSSITTAKDIKTLISSLVDLDNSGIASFTPISIGESVKAYSDTVSGVNLAAISNSISAAEIIRSFISSLSSLKTTGISSFTSATNELSKTNFSGVSKSIENSAKNMQTSGQTLMTNLSAGILNGSNSLTATIAGIFTKAARSIRSKAGIFRSAGASLASGAASGFASNRGGLISAAGSAASAGASIINSYRSSFVAAGAYLVKGFATGIELSSYVAEIAAREMAAKAAEAAKKELKEHSPSRVFMKIGEYTVKGFAIGLTSLGDEVEDSARGMASKAIMTTRTAMTTMLDTLNSDMDAQPTIKPVVDLSDVQTGADAISGMFSGAQTIGVRSNLNAINMAMNEARQNGGNNDIISAINKLANGLENVRGDTYNFGGFTYDDGSNVSDAVETLIRYARIGRRR